MAIADEQIVQLYWQRDERAIQETDKKYGRLLLHIARNILHDDSDCEECRNDVYLRAWNAIPPEQPRFLRAFLAKVMRNTALDRYKIKSGRKRIPSEFTVSMEDLAESISSCHSVEEEIEAKELGKMISDFVRELTERERFVFIGRFYMAEPVDAIAKDIGVTPSAVYQELRSLKTALKGYLEKKGVEV